MKFEDIIGYLVEAEGLTLREYASKVTDGAIVNIGTFQGKSAIYMASGTTNQIITIDKFHYHLFERYCTDFDVDDQIVEMVKDSTRMKWNEPIGLLFIDGAHTFDEVLADYNIFGTQVISGGVLIFHDYKRFEEGNSDCVPLVIEHLKETIERDFIVEKEIERMLCLRRK